MKREWFVVFVVVLALVAVIFLSPNSFINLSPDGRSIFSQRGSSAVGVGECVDSDGGINYGTRGRTQGTNGNFADSCSGSELTEYFCSPAGNVRSRNYDCFIDGGGSCVLGECVGGGVFDILGQPLIKELIPISEVDGKGLGRSVSVGGNIIVSGAPFDDTVAADSGSAYVFGFDIDDQRWNLNEIITPFDGNINDNFGESVSLDFENGRLAISSSGVYNLLGDIYLYSLVNENWEFSQKITPPKSATKFGEKVLLKDNFLFAASDADGLFVYRIIDGVWELHQELSEAPPGAGYFGATGVDIGGDVLAVGNFQGGFLPNTGEVYIYRYNFLSEEWEFEELLRSSDITEGDTFGFVSIDDERLIVGSIYTGISNTGKVYEFKYNPGNPPGERWEETEIIESPNPGLVGFGEGVSLDYPNMLVSQWTAEKMYFYYHYGEEWNYIHEIDSPSLQNNHNFGFEIDFSIPFGAAGAPNSQGVGAFKDGTVYAVFLPEEFCGNGIIEQPNQEAIFETCDDEGNNGKLGFCNRACDGQTVPDRVFVTSQGWDGNLGGLSGADAKCQNAADNANGGVGLGGTWKAWMSDSNPGGAAEDRIVHNPGPYTLIDETTLIADDWNDLTDEIISNPIEIDENGNGPIVDSVWTGTIFNGKAASDSAYYGYKCQGWSTNDGGSLGAKGNSAINTGGWSINFGGGACDIPRRLYCFEQLPLVGCGNGVVNYAIGETCDDENFVEGDGCNSICQIESGWNCIGYPSECFLDTDLDEIEDAIDNCLNDYNPGQEDLDGDGIGDVCDSDRDGDEINNIVDNCPNNYNPGQEDLDGDGLGDVCDVCTDTDDDGFGNPGFLENTCADDNCPLDFNPGQEDGDGDGVGDTCDNISCIDTDGDGADDFCTLSSGQLSPIGNGFPQSLLAENPPNAVSDVVFDFKAKADLSSSLEFVDVNVNGNMIGTVFVTGATDCANPYDEEQVILSYSEYNELIFGGQDLLIDMLPSAGIDPTRCAGDNWISVDVIYSI
jgi:cysteine-rich repeat protein